MAGITCYVKRKASALFDDSLLEVEGGLGEVVGAAEVAPVVFVGAEGEDFFALGGKAEVGVDDGEDAVFGEHGEEAGGDDVNAREGERKWRVASGEWRVFITRRVRSLIVFRLG